MIPREIIIKTVSTPWEVWVQTANIIIALSTAIGVVFSIWYSRKILRNSEWNSNMSTAPSLTIQCTNIQFWKSETLEGGGSWGGLTNFLEFSDNYIIIESSFSILNQGRGVALGIEKPKIFCEIKNHVKEIDIPVSIGNKENDPATFTLSFIERHDKWLDLMSSNFVDIIIEIFYKNDQGNIRCTSKWFAKIKPFDVEGRRLNIRPRGQKILDDDIKIYYQAIS